MKRLPNRTINIQLVTVLYWLLRRCFSRAACLDKITVALSVSTESLERSFSAMYHIKTWVRKSISNGRFSDVTVLAIEPELTMPMSETVCMHFLSTIGSYTLCTQNHNLLWMALPYLSLMNSSSLDISSTENWTSFLTSNTLTTSDHNSTMDALCMGQ